MLPILIIYRLVAQYLVPEMHLRSLLHRRHRRHRRHRHRSTSSESSSGSDAGEKGSSAAAGNHSGRTQTEVERLAEIERQK